MAIQFWKDLSILVATVEAAGHGKNCVLETTVEPLDITALNTTGWTTLIGGRKSGHVNLDFMSDMADDSLDETFFSLLGVSDVVKSFVTATADGSTAYTMRGVPLSFKPIEGEPGGLAMANLADQPSGPVIRGTLIHPSSVARTSSGTGTERQLGALSATQTMYAGLHVIAASGTTPTLDVIVQSDTVGFASPTTRITFAQAVAKTSAWGTVAGAVTDDYWRVSYTIAGTTPSFTFALICGIL